MFQAKYLSTLLLCLAMISCGNSNADLTPTVVELTNSVTPVSSSLPNSLIAFIGTQNKSKSIAVMTSSGQNIRFLTDTLGEEHQPRWSPDGGKIIFLSNRGLPTKDDNYDLWLVDVETLNLTQLTIGGKLHRLSSLIWSSDGDKILYSQAEGSISVLNLAEKTTQVLGEQFYPPLDLSSDGRWVAIEEAISIDSNISVPGRFLSILDLKNNITTTRNKVSLNTVTNLDWSPNGRYLAIGTFFSSRGYGDLTIVSIQEGKTGETMNLSGEFSFIENEDVYDVSWSPKGTELVFRLTTAELLAKGFSDFGHIYVTDSKLGKIKAIASKNLCNAPQWSSDGAKLVFACKADVETDIWIADRDGSNLEQLTDMPAYEGVPVWQP